MREDEKKFLKTNDFMSNVKPKKNKQKTQKNQKQKERKKIQTIKNS